ncbi:MAG: sulfatase [Deltaproteobacteria bacterium]|nr:sulfatase [Deltaproteobacteria bacterium]
MTKDSEGTAGEQGRRLSGPGAASIGWLVAGAVNALAITRYIGTIPKDATWYASHYFFDAGHFLALAMLSASLVEAYRRWGPRRLWWRHLVLTIAALTIGAFTLTDDLFNMSQRLGEQVGSDLLLVVSVTVVALGVPAAHLIGGWLARPKWRWLAVAGGVAAQAVNPLVLQNDYPAGHLYLAWAGATLSGTALVGAVLPKWLGLPAGLTPGRTARQVAYGVLALAAAWAVVVAPSSAVAAQLLRCNGSVLPPFLGRIRAAVSSSGSGGVQVDVDDWYRDRTHMPPVPSTGFGVPNPVVLLLGVDALRADLALEGKHDDSLRAIARLRAESVTFTRARSPGSQTVYTFTALFSGIHFSQQYWSPAKLRKTRQLWPHEDPTPRFPALLAAANIPSVNYTGAEWMRNQWGVVHGFSEERWVKDKVRYTTAPVLGAAVIERLKKAEKSGPVFLFAHFLDPHAPYNGSKVKGSQFDRYLGECALVDEQLGELLTVLDERPALKERTIVIVMSDHGEAFGEHGTTHHAKTLYDELIRVPLFIRAPGVAPRKVAEPVTLVDLGPTVLDLFGLETPSHFIGQTLVPFLQNQSPTLTRPIIAEGRLKRALVLPDGHKIIVDDRNHTTELYDLTQDPGELHNLADDPARLAKPKALLDKYFQVHRIQREGYRIPYRP